MFAARGVCVALVGPRLSGAWLRRDFASLPCIAFRAVCVVRAWCRVGSSAPRVRGLWCGVAVLGARCVRGVCVVVRVVGSRWFGMGPESDCLWVVCRGRWWLAAFLAGLAGRGSAVGGVVGVWWVCCARRWWCFWGPLSALG